MDLKQKAKTIESNVPSQPDENLKVVHSGVDTLGGGDICPGEPGQPCGGTIIWKNEGGNSQASEANGKCNRCGKEY